MQLSSIIAVTFFAQSILASTKPLGNQNPPTTAAGNRVAADLDDPDKIPYTGQWGLCMTHCKATYVGWWWNRDEDCRKRCNDLRGK
ncbi:hypothetical protein PgNI_11100 [Pyricularia grisea]|uniref:Uncharacterized protein n=1 Tax=Pyricularia grisea TaxID=148305 RepID=A0A6P8AYZ6_PYRGI|nr:hypothetical protein PgNI_11100 [Pyricularia grisea]TLD07471.1 hypothetical protein PgNI_11100 [Pyricularia grisea]